MNVIECVLVLLLVVFLNVFTVIGSFALAWFAVLAPMKDDIAALWSRSKAAPAPLPIVPGFPVRQPSGTLPSMDELPDEIFEIGNYGDSQTTADEIEEKMTDLQVANREAEQAWKDMEELRHGKGNPIIYSG